MLKEFDALAECSPRAVVFHCADPKLQKTFRDFLRVHKNLNQDLGDYVPISLLGGAAGLLEEYGEKSPGGNQFLSHQIKFVPKIFSSVEKIIVIAHQNCAYYSAVLGESDTLRPKKDLLQEDNILSDGLAGAVRNVAKQFNLSMEAEFYYGRTTPRRKMFFEPVGSLTLKSGG